MLALSSHQSDESIEVAVSYDGRVTFGLWRGVGVFQAERGREKGKRDIHYHNEEMHVKHEPE